MINIVLQNYGQFPLLWGNSTVRTNHVLEKTAEYWHHVLIYGG